MKKLIFSSLLFFLVLNLVAQGLTQTLRGTVSDADSKLPLQGVSVLVVGLDPSLMAATDANGEFRFDQVPLGRISLHLSLIGYESLTIPDIEINSGKEKILTIGLQESVVKLEEVTITAAKSKGAAVNDMSLVSTRAISPEESRRYAGSFNDPSKVLSNFAGVTNSQNGQNDIIVRGNSPKYVQWRLEGVEISNPTHFADQNSIKGGISALNNSLLATSDFSTGAFAPEYGNVLSGVYDVNLRAGNNQKLETSAGIGILGTDLTLEGPFKKGYGGSFLINYRYSTIALVSSLGLLKADGVLRYQDATFKVVLPAKKAGEFSLFGLGGLSGFHAYNVKPEVTTTPTNETNPANVNEEYKKSTFLGNCGLNHTIKLSGKSFLKTTFAYTNNGITEDIFQVKTTPLYDAQGNYVYDSSGAKEQTFKSRLLNSTYIAASSYHHKISSKSSLQVGTKYALMYYDYSLSFLQGNPPAMFTAMKLDRYISTVRNFVSWKYRITPAITMVAGFHNMNVVYNRKSTVEPRIAVSYKFGASNRITLGYGSHSAMESMHNYFARVALSDGSSVEPNRHLDLLKAHHYVAGYEKRLTENVRAKIELYYQQLYNLPVENNDTSYYATINEGTDLRYVSLVNKGKGKNYGIELTIERFFSNRYYFLVNGSLYNSTYQALDGIERNTRYNSNYLVNILGGKEFAGIGRKKNQVLTLNAKFFLGGGQRYIPLLRDASGALAVDPAANKYWNYSKAYHSTFGTIYQLTLSASYKWNRPGATHEVFINLDNVTNATARLTEYYSPSEPNATGYIRQFGFFPNLMYRLYF